MVGILNGPPFYRNIGPNNGGQGMLTPYLEQPQQPIIPQPQMAAQPTPGAAQAGILDKISNWFQQNPQAISGLAAGLVAGPSSRDALAQGFAGWGRGQANDRVSADKLTRSKAMTALIKAKQTGQPITPEMYEAAGLGDKYAEHTLFGKNAEREIRNDANGIPRYTDTGDAVFGADLNPAGGGGVFGGKSTEAQGLNILIENGTLTKHEAAELAAGKTVTGPNGEIIFATPSGIFGKQPGQQPQLLTPPSEQNAGVPPMAGSPSAAPQASEGGPPVPSASARPGMIQLTNPKSQGTDTQMTSALYADRMRKSNAIIDKLETAGTSLPDQLKSGVPVVGNYLISDEYRQLDQAQRDFINATLRRESGAVISPDEFDNARKQYFPQPGDDPATIKNKRANRATAIDGISRAAGSNYQPPPPPAPPPDKPPPAGVDPALWNVMTPEEKALFQ